MIKDLSWINAFYGFLNDVMSHFPANDKQFVKEGKILLWEIRRLIVYRETFSQNFTSRALVSVHHTLVGVHQGHE